MSEKQLKAIEAEYRELVQSSSSSIRKDKAGVRVVEISVLRKLCQAESGVITGKKGKGKESANAKALDLICEILREGRSSECGEGLPLDLDLAGQLVGLAKGSIETFGARKAVSLLDILVTDYPKVVVNASVLPDTISQLVALRRTGKDEDKKEGEEEKEEGDEDEDRECFERILEFYGSYCLGYFDQLRVLQTNLTKIFPALLQSLGAQDGNKKVAIEALHSLIVTPLAKDMCERAFGVKDETDITAPPAEKKAKTVKGSDKSVFADKVCDRIKELMEKPENSSVLGIPAFFDNFTETVKLEAQATRLQAGKSSSSSASIDSQQGKRADANLADKVCLELLDRLLALTNANIQRSTTTAIDSTVLRAAGRLVPNLAKIYGMHRLAAEETKMLEELTAKALPALATHTEAAEELFTAVLQVDNLVVEKHIPQILSKVAASKHSGRGVFLLGFIDTYTKLRQVDTTFTDTTLEAFALMIAEGCAAGSVFTPEASIRLGETVFLRLIPAQVSTVMEKLLAFYNAHFAAVPSANADTVATVFHEFCVMWIAVASGASTVSAPLLGAAIGKTLKALVEGFKGINVEEEEDNDNNNFGWASETLFALCNIMNACQAPKGAGLDAGEFYSVVVKKFFSMCKKACTENSATATPLEKAKAEYAKMELVLAFLRFFDGDDNCERVRQKLLAKVVRHTPDPAKLVPSQPSSSSSSSGAAAPALDPALCDVYFAHWQLTLQNIRTLCTYEKENRVMSLIESLFKSAATSATTDTFTGRLAELSAATLCDASLYQIPFFKHKGVESALNSIFAINTVSTEVDRLGLGSLETLNWEALSAAVGDFRARSEAVMSAEECMCLRHLAALLGIYPAAFYRGVEEKALCYLVLVLAVILRTVPDEWTRARLVDSVVGVTEKIILILINHSNRSNDGDSGYELITKMIPKKFFSLLLREDRMKIFAVYIQSIIDSGSVSDIPAFLEDLCEKGSAERTAEHIAALAVYCADAINTRLLAAQSSDDKTVTAAPDDVTKYFGFVRYCINKLLVFSNDDTVFASKVFSLNTRLLKFNEIYCMYYREGGGTEEKEAAFTELFKKQGSLFLRKLTALVRSNSGASQGRLTGSIVEYVEALVHSICIRKKGVPTPLYARLVALIHFVASHLVVGKSGTEAELSTMKFTYGRLLGKGDPEQRSMCLECIQDELSSQTPERSKTAIAFLEVYVSRTHFLYNETLAGLLFIVSTYASSTSADDLPYAIKAFSNLCWVLSEKLYTDKDGKPKKHLTKEQESEQQQQQKRKPKKDEGGQKGNAVGGLIATYALKCLDEITRRSDITSDIFGELTRFLHFLIPFVHKMTPLLFSIIQNMIVRTFDFYNRGGRNAAALKDAAICGGFVSRILGEISRHGNREWSSSNCHHVIQEYLAQVDYAGGQAKVTPICDSFRTGICAMISQCSEEQLKRIHYLAMSGGKNHFKQLREVYLREFKYKGKA